MWQLSISESCVLSTIWIVGILIHIMHYWNPNIPMGQPHGYETAHCIPVTTLSPFSHPHHFLQPSCMLPLSFSPTPSRSPLLPTESCRERERERSWRLPRTSPHDMLQGFSVTGTIFLSVFPYSPLVSDTQENFYFQRSDA
jgi:hypothetical protein